jgi:hypothetical protein
MSLPPLSFFSLLSPSIFPALSFPLFLPVCSDSPLMCLPPLSLFLLLSSFVCSPPSLLLCLSSYILFSYVRWKCPWLLKGREVGLTAVLPTRSKTNNQSAGGFLFGLICEFGDIFSHGDPASSCHIAKYHPGRKVGQTGDEDVQLEYGPVLPQLIVQTMRPSRSPGLYSMHMGAAPW